VGECGKHLSDNLIDAIYTNKHLKMLLKKVLFLSDGHLKVSLKIVICV